MATPNFLDPTFTLPWLKDASGNPGLDNPKAVDYYNNPDDLILSTLSNLKQSTANPFTQFLTSTLGGSALNGLYSIFAPKNVANSPNDFSKFGAQLLNSFYNPNIPSPGGIDFSDPNLVGNTLSDLFHGTGQAGASDFENAFKDQPHSGIDDASLLKDIGSFIDTLGGFTLGTISKNVAKGQLQDMYGTYLNTDASSSGFGFGSWLAQNAADWLYQNFGVGGATAPTVAPSGNAR